MFHDIVDGATLMTHLAIRQTLERASGEAPSGKIMISHDLSHEN